MISRLRLDKPTLILAAMFGAPIVVAQLAQPMHGFIGAPKPASATPITESVPVDVTPPRVPTAAEKALALKIESFRQSAGETVGTPFYYPPMVEGAPSPTPVVEVRDMPQFTISSIVEAREGRILATINGKLCTVGAVPIEGWRITAIDANAKTVTVVSDETGETLVLTLPRPGA